MKIWIACALALFLVACGPSERPKLNFKKEPHFDPLPVPKPKAIYSEETATTGTDAIIVEVGAFKGVCDHSFTSVNDDGLVALASPKGMNDYRLAGIAIPPEIRETAHGQLRNWLEGEMIGVEFEAEGDGVDPAVYLFRCTAKSMLNADLARAGLAVVSDIPSRHREALNKASMEALTAQRGVWGKK